MRPSVRRRDPRRWLVAGSRLVGVLGIVVGVCGCPQAATAPDTSSSSLDTKDNGTFQTATPITLGEDDGIDFTGRISAGDGVDLFNLGTLETGDRLVVDVRTTSGSLDAVAAVFDANENIHAFNDDRTSDGSNLNPLIDIFVRGATGEYYLGIAPFPDSGTTGAYSVSVSVTRGIGAPPLRPQIVFLDWDGGQNITVNNVGTFNLDPFDSTDVGPYPEQTAALKDRVREIVADRYDGFALTLMNSDDNPVPTEAHSTVYFGGNSRVAFAISEQIDTHNEDPSDNAIVFTGAFRNSFVVTPTFEEMATALGNTTAHEIGHLLGLVHTKDCSSLMDTTCGNSSLLVEQAFKLATIDDSVFPVGNQDAPSLLEWTLGLAGL